MHADGLLLGASEGDVQKLRDELSSRLKIKWGEFIEENWTKYLGKLWRKRKGRYQVKLPREYYQKMAAVYGMERAKPIVAPFIAAKELR